VFRIAYHTQEIVAVLAFGKRAMRTGGDYLLLGLIGTVDEKTQILVVGNNAGFGAPQPDVQNGHIDVGDHQVGVQFPRLGRWRPGRRQLSPHIFKIISV